MKNQEVLIAHPASAKKTNALKSILKALDIKFEVAKESPYDAEFVRMIKKSRKDYSAGKGRVFTVAELEKLWK